ncbi:MAG: acylpyruvase, partial [Desulfuromonas sp.]
RQNGNSIDMLPAIPAIIAYVSSRFTLEAGDIILTGTPSGVGPVEAGETVVATIDKVGSLTVTIQRETK